MYMYMYNVHVPFYVHDISLILLSLWTEDRGTFTRTVPPVDSLLPISLADKSSGEWERQIQTEIRTVIEKTDRYTYMYMFMYIQRQWKRQTDNERQTDTDRDTHLRQTVRLTQH